MAILKKIFGDDFDEDREDVESESSEEQALSEASEEIGELAVDMYQEGDSVIVKSTIAGVKPEDLDITVASDMLSIRGERQTEEEVNEDDYFYQECYWGTFQRNLQLPFEVDVDKVEAEIVDGVLTLTLPRAGGAKQKKIKVKSE